MNVDELLKIAAAPNNAQSRADLAKCLEAARLEGEHAKRAKEVPAIFFKQLNKSITKTLMLLARLEKYSDWRDICFGMYISGDGTAIAVSHQELFDGKLTLPRNPPPRPVLRTSNGRPVLDQHGRPVRGIPTSYPDSIHVGVNVRAALHDMQQTVIGCAPKPKKGQPEKVDRSACVHFAKKFFVAYSSHKASTDPKNPFTEFCEHFYRAVNGKAVKTDSLAWFIRAALKNTAVVRTPLVANTSLTPRARKGRRWTPQVLDLDLKV